MTTDTAEQARQALREAFENRACMDGGPRIDDTEPSDLADLAVRTLQEAGLLRDDECDQFTSDRYVHAHMLGTVACVKCGKPYTSHPTTSRSHCTTVGHEDRPDNGTARCDGRCSDMTVGLRPCPLHNPRPGGSVENEALIARLTKALGAVMNLLHHDGHSTEEVAAITEDAWEVLGLVNARNADA